MPWREVRNQLSSPVAGNWKLLPASGWRTWYGLSLVNLDTVQAALFVD